MEPGVDVLSEQDHAKNAGNASPLHRPFLQRFRSDERGVTAVIFGIVFSVLLMAVALAIDYTLAVTEKLDEQAALDAATLAAAKRIGQENQDIAAENTANAFFKANLSPTSEAKINSLSIDAESGTLGADAGMSMATKILKLFGYKEIDISVSSTVAQGRGNSEIAMVLDNSGSMSGSYINDLKTAAQDLSDIVLGASNTTGMKFRIGLVPFAASVNVGAHLANSSWIDTGVNSPIHSENFDKSASRFSMFANLGTNWAGCVEARPAPYDVNDAEPNNGNPATFFVPMFAPDEPDDINARAAGYSNYPNNYLSDFGGSCPPPSQTCKRWNRKTGKCKYYEPDPISVESAQSRTCKYDGASVSGGSGPNYMCTTREIEPLTPESQTIRDAISAMGANGYTNIAEGVAWGWRVLSPGLPFNQGHPYHEDNRKTLIVMTDGENVYNARSNHNLSYYGARGFAAKGRLGTTYSSSGYRSEIDDKVRATCSNAKALGVTIYTVAFRLEGDANTTALLKDCATSDDHFFPASNGDALIQSFQNIGREIAQLRVAS